MQQITSITLADLEKEQINLEAIANSNYTGWDNVIALVAGFICPLGAFTYGYVKGMCEASSNILKKKIKTMVDNGYGSVKTIVDYTDGNDYGTGNSGAVSGYKTAKINSVSFVYER